MKGLGTIWSYFHGNSICIPQFLKQRILHLTVFVRFNSLVKKLQRYSNNLMITFSSIYSGITRLNDRARHDAAVLAMEMLRLDGLFFVNNEFPVMD